MTNSKATIASVLALYLKTQHPEPDHNHYRDKLAATNLVETPADPLMTTDLVVGDLEPDQLEALHVEIMRDRLALTLVRSTINERMNRIRTMLRWAARRRLMSTATIAEFDLVERLKPGQRGAKDNPPIEATTLLAVKATIEALALDAMSARIQRDRIAKVRAATMIEVQLLTGARPGEVRKMRRSELNMSGTTWLYRPNKHKTSRHGRSREIHIGPQAQTLLRPSVAQAAKAQSDRLWTLKRMALPGLLTRVQKKHGIEHWTLNQLRHRAATDIRTEFGLDVAQRVLGHATSRMTERYAKIAEDQAADAMRAIG